VLQAQQTLFGAENAQIQSRLAQYQADVGLYQALGGGWSENPEDRTQTTTSDTPPPPPKPEEHKWCVFVAVCF